MAPAIGFRIGHTRFRSTRRCCCNDGEAQTQRSSGGCCTRPVSITWSRLFWTGARHTTISVTTGWRASAGNTHLVLRLREIEGLAIPKVTHPLMQSLPSTRAPGAGTLEADAYMKGTMQRVDADWPQFENWMTLDAIRRLAKQCPDLIRPVQDARKVRTRASFSPDNSGVAAINSRTSSRTRSRASESSAAMKLTDATRSRITCAGSTC